MAMTLTVNSTINDGGAVRFTNTASVDVGASASVDETISNAETNKQVTVAVPLTGLKMFALMADQNVNVKTNSSGSPQETFTLVAGKPIVWVTGDVDSAPIAGAVSSLFVTNASGFAARVQLLAGWDPTP